MKYYINNAMKQKAFKCLRILEMLLIYSVQCTRNIIRNSVEQTCGLLVGRESLNLSF